MLDSGKADGEVRALDSKFASMDLSDRTRIDRETSGNKNGHNSNNQKRKKSGSGGNQPNVHYEGGASGGSQSKPRASVRRKSSTGVNSGRQTGAVSHRTEHSMPQSSSRISKKQSQHLESRESKSSRARNLNGKIEEINKKLANRLLRKSTALLS